MLRNYLVSYQFKSKPTVMGFSGGEHECGRSKKPRWEILLIIANIYMCRGFVNISHVGMTLAYIERHE